MASTSHCLLFVGVLVMHCSALARANSIQGCGGFVEASSALIKSRKPTDGKLDYSHVTVELRTVDGLVKDRTQCAPNGYYFIPVYDKGSFVIKVRGPDGWSVAPEQVPVVIDHTGCNANEDINFQYTGFTLSGRVLGAVGGDSCSYKNSGPSDVNVELLSTSGDIVSSVLTTPTGSYSFKNIIPGEYKIRATHHDLDVEVRGSDEVKLGFDNGLVEDIFVASGYDIRGFVVAQGNPILGVHFYLYSDDVLGVDCPHDSGNAPGLGRALCHAVSDADGMFTFKSIPCGTYKIVPFYKGENTVFDVSPSSLLVPVHHGHAVISQKFQVTGFSVGGRVVGDGIGVQGVKILVDGQERSTTDREGYYKLDQVTSKRYSIEARKEHYKFEMLNDFLVLPNMASITDIKAVSYDVCGTAQTISSDYKAKVALTHGPETVKPQVKQPDENGNFCFEVAPGEYRLSAFAAKPASVPELLFSPAYMDITVNKPILSVKFYQAQVNVRGSVLCKENCRSSVSVMLVKSDGHEKEEHRTVTLTDQSNDFSFSNVLPGKYRIEVRKNSPGIASGQDTWCWEQSFKNVDVGAEDVEGIIFTQKGYWLQVVSSHDVDAKLIQSDGSQADFKFKKGSQRICIDSPGVHELHLVSSCISFGTTSLKIDTSNHAPIHVKGEKYLLKGQINLEANNNLPDNIIVDVLDHEGAVLDGTSGRLISTDENENTIASYEYSFWANFGEKLIFVPRDSRDDTPKKILFYPRQHHVQVTEDKCQARIAPFSGRLGKYIEGSVNPPLTHVLIRVFAKGYSHVSLLKQGDLATETSTGEDGIFLAGPLYDDIGYTVEASKSGYHLKRVGENSFSCQKLGQISVRLYSRDDSSEPFPSVLLSLSGEDGYRNNSVTDVGGIFVFDNLFPGSFYLRPLLKEYAFSPPAEAIELGSGESKEVVFHADRVAFSVFGKVSLLSGQPKEGVTVEARAESDGFYEETVTDSLGRYRLRGLHPDTTYSIKIASKDEVVTPRIERASPESLIVKVGHEDLKDRNFVVFEQPDMTILSGHVEGKNIRDLNSHIRVEIRSANDPSNIVSTFPLPISNFFQVKNLPKGKHLLQLRSSMLHRFDSEVIEVDLEKQPQIHVGPLSYRIEEDIYKQELTIAPVYPLFVGVLAIGLFMSLPRLKDLYQASIGTTMAGSSSSANLKKDVKKPVIRKKTY